MTLQSTVRRKLRRNEGNGLREGGTAEDRRSQAPLAPAQGGTPHRVGRWCLEAVRLRGSDISMDEIAAEIGVSKTVLYRYFVDKNDLTTAVMMRFTQTTLIPNMAVPYPRTSTGSRSHA